MKSPERRNLWIKSAIYDPKDSLKKSRATSGLTTLEAFSDAGKSMSDLAKAQRDYENALKDLNNFLNENREGLGETLSEAAKQMAQAREQSLQSYKEAYEALAKGETASAIEKLNDSITKSDSAEARHQLGKAILSASGDKEKALENLEKAIELYESGTGFKTWETDNSLGKLTADCHAIISSIYTARFETLKNDKAETQKLIDALNKAIDHMEKAIKSDRSKSEYQDKLKLLKEALTNVGF